MRYFRIFLLLFAVFLLLNFAIFNDPAAWFVINTLFIITPVWYYFLRRQNLDVPVLIILTALGLLTIYQIAVGKALDTTPDLMWQIIDTAGVIIYAYLAGSGLRLPKMKNE